MVGYLKSVRVGVNYTLHASNPELLRMLKKIYTNCAAMLLLQQQVCSSMLKYSIVTA